MTLPARHDEDDPPPPIENETPQPMVWTIAGGGLVLAFIALLALLARS